MKLVLGALFAALTITTTAQTPSEEDALIDSLETYWDAYDFELRDTLVRRTSQYGAGLVIRAEHNSWSAPPVWEIVTVGDTTDSPLVRFLYDETGETFLGAESLSPSHAYTFSPPVEAIDFEEARELASGASEGALRSWTLALEDGAWFYRFRFESADGLIECAVDAEAGALVDCEPAPDRRRAMKTQLTNFANASVADSAVALFDAEIVAVEEAPAAAGKRYDITFRMDNGGVVSSTFEADGTLVGMRHVSGPNNYWINALGDLKPYYRARYFLLQDSPDMVTGWEFRKDDDGKWRYYFTAAAAAGVTLFKLSAESGNVLGVEIK
ncbi:MAG: hypothetical protein GF419_08050 [Ignavibacteriales bacterium]|nr:hypothetical protein [Ignavibacteriales bacterium]